MIGGLSKTVIDQTIPLAGNFGNDDSELASSAAERTASGKPGVHFAPIRLVPGPKA